MKEFKTSTRTITDRNDICIAGYLRDISRIERISPEEEAQLSRDIKKGGRIAEKAKKRLIEANLRFVVSVANQYKNKNVPLADLISEGNIGLVKAAEIFDETRGFKFISYAVWWIRQSIMAALDEYSTTLHLPSNQQRLLAEYKRLDKDMMQLEQRHITIDEFCEVTGASHEKIASALGASMVAVKMDAPMGDDSDATLGDMMTSGSHTDSNADQESLRQDVREILRRCLKPREQDIVCRFYGIDREVETLEAIAESYGLSRERTRQICLKSIVALRESRYSEVLAGYLAA